MANCTDGPVVLDGLAELQLCNATDWNPVNGTLQFENLCWQLQSTKIHGALTHEKLRVCLRHIVMFIQRETGVLYSDTIVPVVASSIEQMGVLRELLFGMLKTDHDAGTGHMESVQKILSEPMALGLSDEPSADIGVVQSATSALTSAVLLVSFNEARSAGGLPPVESLGSLQEADLIPVTSLGSLQSADLINATLYGGQSSEAVSESRPSLPSFGVFGETLQGWLTSYMPDRLGTLLVYTLLAVTVTVLAAKLWRFLKACMVSMHAVTKTLPLALFTMICNLSKIRV